MSAEAAPAPAAPARRTFRTFEFRGVELDKLLTLSEKQVYDMFFVQDNISNMAHIVGGIVGAIFGFALRRRKA